MSASAHSMSKVSPPHSRLSAVGRRASTVSGPLLLVGPWRPPVSSSLISVPAEKYVSQCVRQLGKKITCIPCLRRFTCRTEVCEAGVPAVVPLLAWQVGEVGCSARRSRSPSRTSLESWKRFLNQEFCYDFIVGFHVDRCRLTNQNKRKTDIFRLENEPQRKV